MLRVLTVCIYQNACQCVFVCVCECVFERERKRKREREMALSQHILAITWILNDNLK